MKLAPIVLFVYNRSLHTQQTVESLKKNEMAKDSELIIYSDGPRTDVDALKVDEVRSYIRRISGFRNITIIEQPANLGLARSIINGITDVMNAYDRIIVLEDDLITSRFFLQYMNEALALYENEDKVISIQAYINPVKGLLPDTFFLRYVGCWGWGTWRRAWSMFEPDAEKLLCSLEINMLTRQFDMNGSYFFTRMLKDHINGEINSWAIRWHASAFLNDKLTLFPGRSLVNNIGHDGSGRHCDSVNYFNVEFSMSPIEVTQQQIEENLYARRMLENYFRSTMWRIRFRLLRDIIRKAFYTKLIL